MAAHPCTPPTRTGGGSRTPSARRRRKGIAVYEPWVEAEAAPSIIVSPDPAELPRLDAVHPPPPPVPPPLQPNAAPSLGRPHGSSNSGLEAIVESTKLLQRLDRLEALRRRPAGLPEDDPTHADTRVGLRQVCADLLVRYPQLALAKHVDELLRASWEESLSAARSRSSNGGGLAALHDALYRTLQDYTTLIAALVPPSAPSASAVSAETATLVYRLSLAHAGVVADLEKLMDPMATAMTEVHVDAARRWAPGDGEAHCLLVPTLLRGGRRAEALYHLMRNRLAPRPHVLDAEAARRHLTNIRVRTTTTASQATLAMPATASTAMAAFEEMVIRRVHVLLRQRRSDANDDNNDDENAQIEARNGVALTCRFLDAICSEPHDPAASARAMGLVRVVVMAIACAYLPPPSDDDHNGSGGDSMAGWLVVGRRHSQSPPRAGLDWEHPPPSLRGAVAWVVELTSVLAQRGIVVETSPCHAPAHKLAAIGLLLPALVTALTWLQDKPWRRLFTTGGAELDLLQAMLSEALTAHHGPIASSHDDGDPAGGGIPEDIELAGFPPLSSSSTAASPPPVASDPGTAALERVQRTRIGRILKLAQRRTHHRRPLTMPTTSTPSAASSDWSTAAASPPRPVRDADDFSRDARPTATITSSTASSSSSPSLSSTGTSASASPQSGTTAAVSPVNVPVPTSGRVVVVDAANVAMRHGRQRRQFSCRGIHLCARHFLARGDRVVAFLPDYCITDPIASVASASSSGARRGPPLAVDDRRLLVAMVDAGLLVLTPAPDSDDAYCIHYARRHDAFVVTNDLFRDHVAAAESAGDDARELRAWLGAHRISFAWVGDEFVPNPHSQYERDTRRQRRQQRQHRQPRPPSPSPSPSP